MLVILSYTIICFSAAIICLVLFFWCTSVVSFNKSVSQSVSQIVKMLLRVTTVILRRVLITTI